MRRTTYLPAIAFALLWAALAVVNPETTYHLAPTIVAAIPPMHPGDRRLVRAFAGTGIAVVVAIGLAAAGLLDGPSLLPFGDALTESLLGAVAGGALGATVRTVADRRIPERT